jgi:hypothetical protein
MSSSALPNIGNPVTIVDGTCASDSWESSASATRWSPPPTASR